MPREPSAQVMPDAIPKPAESGMGLAIPGLMNAATNPRIMIAGTTTNEKIMRMASRKNDFKLPTQKLDSVPDLSF